MKRQHEIGPYWQDEDDWLCTIEFLPGGDPERRLFGADIVGYLVGYAQLTNTVFWHSSAILMPALTSFYFPFRLQRRTTSS
jgi:hypothetical protein